MMLAFALRSDEHLDKSGVQVCLTIQLDRECCSFIHLPYFIKSPATGTPERTCNIESKGPVQ